MHIASINTQTPIAETCIHMYIHLTPPPALHKLKYNQQLKIKNMHAYNTSVHTEINTFHHNKN